MLCDELDAFQDEGGIMAAASGVGMADSHEDMMAGGSSSSSSAGASMNAVMSTAATHSYSAGGDTHSLDAHTAQIRNMQRLIFRLSVHGGFVFTSFCLCYSWYLNSSSKLIRFFVQRLINSASTKQVVVKNPIGECFSCPEVCR